MLEEELLDNAFRKALGGQPEVTTAISIDSSTRRSVDASSVAVADYLHS